VKKLSHLGQLFNFGKVLQEEAATACLNLAIKEEIQDI
jgi:hypothetical protein